MTLDIIVPVYNEENLICTTLGRILETGFGSLVKDYTVIVVDDCSTDGTCRAVEQFVTATASRNIKLFKLSKNSGKGAAVRYGISRSNGDLIVIQDADLELTPSDIPSMIDALLRLNIQFVNGSRYLPGIPRPLSSYRRYLANRFMTWLTSLLINVKLTDIACGYKLFHRCLYDQLDLRENRFGFEAEIIIKALRIRKNNIAEVPVNYFPRNKGEGKKIRTIDGVKLIWTIVKYSVIK
jgi:glycosyltransferase involved in cell wall biosynthesis